MHNSSQDPRSPSAPNVQSFSASWRCYPGNFALYLTKVPNWGKLVNNNWLLQNSYHWNFNPVVAQKYGQMLLGLGGNETLISVFKLTLDSVGLIGAAQRLKRTMQARGLMKWRPLVPQDEFSASCKFAIRILGATRHQFGDYLEFGVSRGTSMASMYHVLRRAGLSNVRLVGFDSFEGLPSEAEWQGWKPGDFASTLGATQRYLKRMNVDLDWVHLVKGWFKDTLTPETAKLLILRKASIIMVDCDIYTASKEALWFCAPLITDRAVIIFDDWGWRTNVDEIGQREAYAEFLDAFPHFTSQPLPAYVPQARMFLVARITV